MPTNTLLVTVIFCPAVHLAWVLIVTLMTNSERAFSATLRSKITPSLTVKALPSAHVGHVCRLAHSTVAVVVSSAAPSRL